MSGGLSIADMEEEVLQMQTFDCFVAKTFKVFENYGVSVRTSGLRECRHFMNKVEEVNFVRTSFVYGPLQFKLNFSLHSRIMFHQP